MMKKLDSLGCRVRQSWSCAAWVPMVWGAIVAANAVVPKFEVVSIKPCKADQVGARGGGSGGSSVDRLTLSCQNRGAYLIETAYRPHSLLPSAPIEGRQAWVNSDGYSIEAKAAGTPGQEAMKGPMLRGASRRDSD